MTFGVELIGRIGRGIAQLIPPALRRKLKSRLVAALRAELQPALRAELRAELQSALRAELRAELQPALRAELMAELQSALKAELQTEIVPMIGSSVQKQLTFFNEAKAFEQFIDSKLCESTSEASKAALVEQFSVRWRSMVRLAAGLSEDAPQSPILDDMIQEIRFLVSHCEYSLPVFKALTHKRVLFAGQAYYNAWYLSRALRDLGWKADVLNWDVNPDSQIYYHGEDISFDGASPSLGEQMLGFYLLSLYSYDVFHFSNAHGMCFGLPAQNLVEQYFSKHAEIRLLKDLGKIVVYSNNGCLDGVSQSSFSTWSQPSICSICRWQHEPTVCSDQRNLDWGQIRNTIADYQCLLGGNRIDYNDSPTVHEVPEFYCLDKNVWHPDIEIPPAFRLAPAPKGTVWLYHAVGNKLARTSSDGVNIKSSHIYLPLINRFKNEGMLVELLEPSDIPNKDVRFLQAQADIFLDMLSYGWFGATAREAMMLGKPVICYIRPEWLESVKQEIPSYAAELPIISATPDTIEATLRNLIANPELRHEIGLRGRRFAEKWHSAEAGGVRFDDIYRKLLQGDPLLRASLVQMHA